MNSPGGRGMSEESLCWSTWSNTERYRSHFTLKQYVISKSTLCYQQLTRLSPYHSGGRPSSRVDVQQYLGLPPQADSGQAAARQPVRGGDGCQKLCRSGTTCYDDLQNWQRYNTVRADMEHFKHVDASAGHELIMLVIL